MSKKLTILLTLFILIINTAACAKDKAVSQVPELISPKGSEIVYEPVIITDVGNTESSIGQESHIAYAKPQEYCQFFLKDVTVDDICVAVGSYVEKGEVIATVDTSEIDRQIASKQAEIEYLQGRYLLEEKEAELDYKAEQSSHRLTYWNYEADPYEMTSREIEDMNGSLRNAEEARRLNKELLDFNVKCLTDEIARLSSQKENTGLLANHSGYVSYIKDLNQGKEAGPDENIAVIVDYDTTFLEVSDISCQEKIFEKFDECICEIDGRKYKVVQAGFSNVEYQVMQSKKEYCNLRVEISDYDGKFEAGEGLEIVFRQSYAINVPAVRKDSVYQDSEGHFVFVKTDAGEEKRRVITGNSDKHYTQIVEGLSEGELVRREVNPLLKGEKEKIAVFEEIPISNWKYAEYYEKQYFSKKEGIVSNIAFETGAGLQKGDVVFTYKTTGGKTEVVRLEKEIENNLLAYIDADKASDDMIDSYDRARYKSVIIPLSAVREQLKDNLDENTRSELEKSENRLSESQNMYDCMIEAQEVEKEIHKYDYLYTDNKLKQQLELARKDLNGEGTFDVAVKSDGVLGKISVKNGSSIKPGTVLFVEKIQWDRRFVIYTDKDLCLGQKITFNGPDNSFTGKISGYVSASKARAHTTVSEDMVFLTKDAARSSQNAYYVTMDDDSAYDTINQNYDCLVSILAIEEKVVDDKVNS